MNHQALARKWRPYSFDTLVGQSHVVRALTNALNQQRLHHAYLFTGTRGVGKTTLGRLLAKCLNCETGITATPCNTCIPCQEITQGCFIDLIEVDAASRTKVEDTRELLENVPYAPTSGRFKVYLIDEVHMLSSHSFNALLKTLEEPPPHVKFFLATTDPQKLPMTVLSRCLQFHLKALSVEQIAQQLDFILQQESVPSEAEALTRLARAAEGSMRDALSLLDQAIAFGHQKVTTSDVKLMLGTIEANHIYDLLEALVARQAQSLIALTQDLAEQSLDFANILEELLSLLHQIAILQFAPETDLGAWDKERISAFANTLSPQDIQLFYQIALIGRKDLALAPTPRIGLEMVLLRMLAFQPALGGAAGNMTPPGALSKSVSALSQPTPSVTASPAAASPITAPSVVASPVTAPSAVAASAVTVPSAVAPLIAASPAASTEWQSILSQLTLNGLTAAIAQHCFLEKLTEDEVYLVIEPAQSVLLNKKQEERLEQALRDYFKRPVRLSIRSGETHKETPAAKTQQEQTRLQSAAEESMQQDSNIQTFIQTFNAKILPDSIEAN